MSEDNEVNSRSRLKRIAALKGEPAPTFLPSSEGIVKSPDRCPRCGSLEKPFLSLKCASVNENSHPWHHEPSVPLKSETANPFNSGMSGYVRVPPPALKSETVPASEQLVIDLARELYDKFAMGGWLPSDAHQLIREMLAIPCETVPTEAANSRSMQKRIAVLKGEPMPTFGNSESETVEERAQFERWAVVRIPDGPVFHWIESEHRYAHELYQIAFEAYLLAFSLPRVP